MAVICASFEWTDGWRLIFCVVLMQKEIRTGRGLSPFFRFTAVRAPSGGRDVRIRTDASGAVLILTPPPAEGSDQPAPAYLIDIRAMPGRLAKLRLSWRRHQPDVLVKASLEASKDLTQWHSLVDPVSLADIRHGDLRLENREIALPPASIQI